jgi:hypothetical protein
MTFFWPVIWTSSGQISGQFLNLHIQKGQVKYLTWPFFYQVSSIERELELSSKKLNYTQGRCPHPNLPCNYALFYTVNIYRIQCSPAYPVFMQFETVCHHIVDNQISRGLPIAWYVVSI